MNLRQRQILNKRLPSYAGVLVLLLALGITVVLSRNTVFFVTKATVGSTPRDIQVSNISATSFTVSYITDAKVTGTLAYGADAETSGIGLDVRDQTGAEPAEYNVHYIDVQELTPSTTYYFTIASGSQTADNNGLPFEVTTGPEVAPPSADSTLKGQVAYQDGTFPTEGVVSVSNETSQILTGLIQPDGSYTIPISTMKTDNFIGYMLLNETTKFTVSVNAGGTPATAEISGNQTEVPRIILGEKYDFSLNTETIASESAQPASESADFPAFEETVGVDSPTITAPEQAQAYKDSQPLFKGMALPNTEVLILIQSEKEISATLQSDEAGRWEFRPPAELEPGNHKVTIESPDLQGIMQTISREFTVYAEGSQFIEPSVSPVETEFENTTPTIDPRTLTPTIDPKTLTPTIDPKTLTPTIDPKTLTPTIDPNASLSGQLTPTRGPLNETGSATAVVGIVSSVLFLASGAILFFLIAV